MVRRAVMPVGMAAGWERAAAAHWLAGSAGRLAKLAEVAGGASAGPGVPQLQHTGCPAAAGTWLLPETVRISPCASC